MKSPRPTKTQALALLVGGGGLILAACGSGSTGSTAGAIVGAPTGSSATMVSLASVDGTQTLADAGGHTLYSTSSESGGHIRCVTSCTSIWQPVMASRQQARQDSATLHRTFAVVRRPDGGTQLTYRGLPLYSFTAEGAGQLSGNGAHDSFNGTSFTWASALTPGAASAAPSTSSGGGTSGGGMYGY